MSRWHVLVTFHTRHTVAETETGCRHLDSQKHFRHSKEHSQARQSIPITMRQNEYNLITATFSYTGSFVLLLMVWFHRPFIPQANCCSELTTLLEKWKWPYHYKIKIIPSQHTNYALHNNFHSVNLHRVDTTTSRPSYMQISCATTFRLWPFTHVGGIRYCCGGNLYKFFLHQFTFQL